MWNKIQRVIGAVVIMAVLTGCGQYGALYMPAPPKLTHDQDSSRVKTAAIAADSAAN